jgi:hypothetical protein
MLPPEYGENVTAPPPLPTPTHCVVEGHATATIVPLSPPTEDGLAAAPVPGSKLTSLSFTSTAVH